MTSEIHHQIDIDALPERVWQELTDIGSYGDWNPFVRRITGDLARGQRLVVRIAPPGGREMTFRPTVLVVEPAKELRWLGRLLVPGVFDGEHRFVLAELPNGRTRFTQSECFSGLLVGLSRGTLAKTCDGFAQMNAALKARAERTAAHEVGSPIDPGHRARPTTPVRG